MALQNTEAVDRFISSILTLISKSRKCCYYKWVRGKSEVTGKELADSMAKEAVQSKIVPSFFLPLTTSHLKYILKLKIKNVCL